VNAKNAAGTSNWSSTWSFTTVVQQYYLTVNSPCGLPTTGEGWYNAGTQVQVTVTSPYVSGATRWTFTNWSGDASGSQNPITIMMDGPKTITANCNTQYYLSVSTPYGTPSGYGWYDAGSTAYAGVSPSIVPGGTGIQYRFANWSGDATGGKADQSNPITMNAPKGAVANWQQQFQLSVSSTYGGHVSGPPDGWYNNGAYIGYLVPVSDVCYYVFQNWSGDINSTQNPLSFYMVGPYTITANFVFNPPSQPSPPSWLSANTDGHSYVQLTWGTVPCALRYMVYRRNPCGSWNIAGASLSTSFLDHPPPSQICYDAYVYAVTVVDILNHESDKSNEAWAYGHWTSP